MKKFLSAVAVSLIVTVLATGIPGWGCVSFAAESTNSPRDFNQLEMPVISINTASDSTIDSDENYTKAQISIVNDEGKYEMTDMDMAIKLRGNSSMYASKKSYKMKFEEKQSLLNLGDGKGKPWCLISNCYDGSLLRNFAVYNFAELLTGIAYSPDCRSVELYINGEYQGVYLLCEDVNVNKDRVAVTEETDEVEKNGYFVEMSRYDQENMFSVDTATYSVKSNLSETESVKKQQMTYITDYIKKSYDALKNGNQKTVEKYIDLNSLVDIYIGNEIVKNVDAGWDSFYMYKDVNGKLCFGPMWDFDLAMGNANCTKGFDSWAGINPYNVLNLNANSNPWFCHALSNKWFRDLVKRRWHKLQDEVNALPKTVIKEAEANNNSYCRNFEKWDVLGKQVYIEPEAISQLKTFKEHYSYLSNWLNNRVKWLTKYYNSKNFTNGIFVNEDGKILSSNYNLVEMSPILALENVPGVDVEYKMSPNLGITMMIRNGGTENWNVQFDVSGFMMEKGAEYELSFDYKCSQERPLSFAIQQNYEPWSAYFTGELDAANDLKHYETTVKATANDSNCALIFNLGGTAFNGTAVTIDNLSIVKKSSAGSVKH